MYAGGAFYKLWTQMWVKHVILQSQNLILIDHL